MKTYKCYKGCSRIPQLYEAGSTGGVATTLALAALESGFVRGMIVSRRYKTFIAYNLEELTKSCGSIYEEYNYMNFKEHNLGQIGKPCDLDQGNSLKIALFCSHTTKPQKEEITRANRHKLSRWNNSIRCWFCLDHVGKKTDISVGDTQVNPKENVLIIWTIKGMSVLKCALKMDMLCVEEIDFNEILERQPYLFRGWKKW